jgi:hypothetical protein
LNIGLHNLDPALLGALAEDLRAVREAPARTRALPSLLIHVAALESGALPAGFPPHRVRTPAAAPPAAFAARCDWETLRQSFQIVRRGREIWVIGGGREGALYGFDELLERLTGVIWAGIRDEHLLFGPPRPLPAGVQSPSFPYRIRDGSGPDSATGAEFHTWLSRNRYNGRVFSGGSWARATPEHRQAVLAQFNSRALHLVAGYHAMDYYLPEAEFAKHPEWFGMRDGKRVRRSHVVLPECPHLNADVAIQPCYSNPDVIATISGNMADQVRRQPEIEIFSVWPHDGVNNWCQCPACRKQAPYELMYKLALAVAAQTPATLPIELIVYANLLTLPRRKLPASDRITTQICPYLRHYTRRFYEPGGPRLVMGTLYPGPDRVNPVDDRDYGKLFRAWSRVWKACGTVPGVFEYGGDLWPDETGRTERQRFLRHPPAALRFDESKWYRAYGVRYTYFCGSYQHWPDSLSQLSMARSLWNAGEPAEAFTGRYYTALAGAGGKALRQALDRVADRLTAKQSPDAPLAELEKAVKRLKDGPAAKRYRLWMKYVRLAWREWDASLQGDLAGALEREKDVTAFLEARLPELKDISITKQILTYSTVRQARLQQWMTAEKAEDYRL